MSLTRSLILLILPCVLAACSTTSTGRVFRDGYVTLTYWPPGDERPSTVFLSGSFNDWQMSDPAFRCVWDPFEEGFSIRFDLEPGRYEYRFVVDGRWIHDPDARESAPDPLGGRLGVFYVVQTDTR
jgi:hypothetical protein